MDCILVFVSCLLCLLAYTVLLTKAFYVSQKHVFIPLTHHILRIRSKEISILEKRYIFISIFLHNLISMLGKNETLLMVLLILY